MSSVSTKCLLTFSSQFMKCNQWLFSPCVSLHVYHWKSAAAETSFLTMLKQYKEEFVTAASVWCICLGFNCKEFELCDRRYPWNNILTASRRVFKPTRVKHGLTLWKKGDFFLKKKKKNSMTAVEYRDRCLYQGLLDPWAGWQCLSSPNKSDFRWGFTVT